MQNGPDECQLNSLETCALNIWPDVNKQYALIYCFEFLVIEGRSKKWHNCFDQLDLPEDPILNCLITGNGTQDFANFTYYVCKAYRGIAAPAACNLS
ncbi:hypothetical protein TanjilG_12798 [Lupinus angustifolius]|uniref:Uncharacterized protein n=1 Tax=Lupinus angustifolius TaxID=3871 RepID=A0A1J7HER7_LUPAN|nr:hypothetical protein TanjilG_12798 [Lupinus angustifolius]